MPPKLHPHRSQYHRGIIIIVLIGLLQLHVFILNTKVIDAANEVINNIDREKLANFFALKNDIEDDEAGMDDKNIEDMNVEDTTNVTHDSEFQVNQITSINLYHPERISEELEKR
ncbi:hypothetical protein Ahy_A09g044311 [Arachis hypogaea]|uniref:Uncharacterized protein n=1 Tax=Arachis hypogaea TaxID=3818 RepID=A0A445BJU0_ARAHY|nr:hypothetical protein Ahy_A09g044311 [Arachis hypogaea]